MANPRPDRADKAVWGVYVIKELAERAKKFIAREKRTLTYLVTEAVDEYLKKRGF